MNIKVEIREITDGKRGIKAFANVLIDNAIIIHNVRVIETEKGRFLAMPYYKFTNESGDEVQHDVVHPISNDARLELEEAVFGAYQIAISGNN